VRIGANAPSGVRRQHPCRVIPDPPAAAASNRNCGSGGKRSLQGARSQGGLDKNAPVVQIDNFHNNTGNLAGGTAALRDIGRSLSSASVSTKDRSLG
jgi:hypothetical protein